MGSVATEREMSTPPMPRRGTACLAFYLRMAGIEQLQHATITSVLTRSVVLCLARARTAFQIQWLLQNTE